MEYHFSDLFTWTSGKPVTPTEGNIPIYGSNGIIGYSDKAKYHNRIILGRVGAYCGSVAYCPVGFDATDNTLITTCDTTKILYSYAYFLLKQFNLNGYAGGAAQPLITQGLLKHLKCNVPAIDQQQRIVDHLSTYDNLIEVNNKRIKVLEQMAENLYKEWFVRFRFPGHETTEFENKTPKGWKIGHLLDEMTFSSGKAKPQEEGKYPVYGGNGITDWCNRYNNENVVIIGRVGAYCGAVYFEPEKCWISDNALYAKSKRKEALTQYYNFYLLKSLQLNLFQGGTGQPLITQGFLSKIRVVIPPYKTVDTFCSAVKPLFKLISIIKDQNLNLIKQRDLLLPRLMIGKLEVTK